MILFIAAGGAFEMTRQTQSPASKITIGANDQVYYERAATPQNARALGLALQGTGYFRGAGNSVLLSKHGAVTEVAFAVDDGAWSHPATIAAFEEIGRRVAAAIGGFPIQVQLADSRWSVHRSVAVGKVLSGSNDAVYYFGAATEEEAVAVALALTDAGYLGRDAATVAIWKEDGAALGFVVGDGVADRPEAISGFVQLTRRIAPSVGGLPIRLRLLDAGMQSRKELLVE